MDKGLQECSPFLLECIRAAAQCLAREMLFCRNCAKKIYKLQNLGLTNKKTCDNINLALEMHVLIAQQDRATAF